MEDLNAILQQLVQFKSSTPTAGRGGEEEGKEEQGEKEEMVDDSASIAVLEQSVVDMVSLSVIACTCIMTFLKSF